MKISSPPFTSHISEEALLSFTLFLGIMDINNGVFTYSNAGHNYPIIKSGAGYFETHKTKNGLVLGFSNKAVYNNEILCIQNGGVVLLYSDGVVEAMDKKGDLYGENRLLTKLNSVNLDIPDVIVSEIQQGLKEFSGHADQNDDITILAMTYKAITNC